MATYRRSFGQSERRASKVGDDLTVNTSVGQTAEKSYRHLRGPPTPGLNSPSIDFDPQSPPPLPTPAASPSPSLSRLDWSDDVAQVDDDDPWLHRLCDHFEAASSLSRTRILADLLSHCTTQQLSFVHQYVSPLLKRDPFKTLPDELCLRILSYIDDPKVLLRASQVSWRWRNLLSDEMTWKNLCDRHDYDRKMPGLPSILPFNSPTRPRTNLLDLWTPGQAAATITNHNVSSPAPLASASAGSRSHDSSTRSRRHSAKSYKSRFKQRYLVDAAWKSGGTRVTRTIAEDGGVVTSLHLTSRYIIAALDNARIHVFDTEGNNQRTLVGHVMGVWAIVPWGDTLVSGGCDRDVRVWDLTTGKCVHVLRGHTSTVRCLRMYDATTAISGSRDSMLRVWDIRAGLCRKVLIGHQASVRCLEIRDDIVVSGSYDFTAKVWSISEGICLQTLQGHYGQIYAIAFDGQRVVTGSLDTNVRVWNPMSGECLAILQGHTSLVGQLQMRGDTLVTGGSDGSVRIWSLRTNMPIHRLAAHDNSVTSLQFDDYRVVSGGSDGRVKIWDLKTGQLIRELLAQGEAIWRVAFEDEKCVALAQRQILTVMEVWSFAAPEDAMPSSRPIDASPARAQTGLAAPYSNRSSALRQEGDQRIGHAGSDHTSRIPWPGLNGDEFSLGLGIAPGP